MLNNHVTSKAEIAKELNLSMPTVLANVNDLLEKGVLEEIGEYASTGGRKAKSIGINKSYCHAMGILITANHIEMVLVNLGDEIIKKDRIRLKFTAELSYCTEVAQKVKTFLEGELAKDTLLGIGVAIPGIIDQKERIVLKSHALGIENYSLRFLEQALELPVYFENDANAAMLAEKKTKVSKCDISVFEPHLRRCILHRWKAVSRAEPESRGVWSHDTRSRWKKVLLWQIRMCRCILCCKCTDTR